MWCPLGCRQPDLGSAPILKGHYLCASLLEGCFPLAKESKGFSVNLKKKKYPEKHVSLTERGGVPVSLGGKCSTEPFFVIRGVQETLVPGEFQQKSQKEREREESTRQPLRGELETHQSYALSSPHSPNWCVLCSPGQRRETAIVIPMISRLCPQLPQERNL